MKRITKGARGVAASSSRFPASRMHAKSATNSQENTKEQLAVCWLQWEECAHCAEGHMGRHCPVLRSWDEEARLCRQRHKVTGT